MYGRAFAGKGTASIHHKVPATTLAYSVWSMAFRCNFVPFWAHGAAHNIRTSMLDACQYAAMHEMNAATKLTMLLTNAERMRVQRLALAMPSAGLMTLEEVAKALNIKNVKGSSCNGGSKGIIDALHTLNHAGSKGTAEILHFCRVASISENILVYDLGQATKDMQIRALSKRMLIDELFEKSKQPNSNAVDFIPQHATHLCACVQCKRVSNALADDAATKWNTTFNEIGTSVSMMSIDAETNECHMRCAKRSSTSMKTSIAMSDNTAADFTDDKQCNTNFVQSMLDDKSTSCGAGTSARMRMDCKSTLEQRACATACGNDCMLTIPLLGKAVRLWQNWYALCAFCGCCVRFRPSNKYHSQICCMRCDFNMLNRNAVSDNSKNAGSKSTDVPKCLYCGRSDPQRSGVRWRTVKAPLDRSGKNLNLPPPLRMVHFCPKHFRSWIPGCMKTMESRVILSHIIYGARPCFDPTMGPQACEEGTVQQVQKTNKHNNQNRKRKLRASK